MRRSKPLWSMRGSGMRRWVGKGKEWKIVGRDKCLMQQSENICIIVATHKKYQMPKEPMYLPLHVGAAEKEDIGYTRDDAGENISVMNPRLCELTGIYWAWKNFDADYIGLVHYRRHFTTMPLLKRLGKNKFDCILTQKELELILKEYDFILPKKRKYGIESIYSHYIHLPYTYEKDLLILRDVIKEKEPDYLQAFDTVMNRSHAHMFNMFIMKRDIFDQYCTWAFPILLETDRRVDVSGYTQMETRAVSYLGEFMIDIWNERQKIPYKELPVMFMEKQNWFVKGGRFIMRKFFS